MSLSNEQLLEKFEQDMRLSFDGLAENTIRGHMAHVRRFLREIDKPAFDISKNEISVYVLTLQKEVGGDMNIDSKQVHLDSIKKFYNFLFDGSDDRQIEEMRSYQDSHGVWREISNPVAKMVSVNSSPTAKLQRNPRKEGLTVKDTQKLLAELRDNIVWTTKRKQTSGRFLAHRDYCMVLLMLETGLRYSDVASITFENLVFNGEETYLNIVTQKTKKKMKFLLSVPLTRALKDYFEVHGERSSLVFCTDTGRVLDNVAANRMLDKHKSRAGIEKEVTCHTLRHTCGALMYAETKDLAFVKELLGHGSITTTQRYVYSEDVVKDMAETTARVTDRLIAM